MKNIVSLFLLIPVGIAFSQDSYENKIKQFQDELNEEFLSPGQSPLTKKERKKFKGHNYFPINENYSVTGEFIKSNEPVTLQMKTTTGRLPAYDKYGVVKFVLNGKPYQLTIYQSHRLRETDEYKNYLFLPFTDLTNGEETYGGGRYIDLSIPEGSEIIIDFNKAYSPSCAYNYSYSCPIPPAENNLELRIEAGVKNLDL
ncbi:DUF1684 domain-containing protein [Fulvivirga sp. M361]|uniref:DUF1684 domain-containing protein n=1 Tax=Fulvivirga sp. M361 TaxID=2594266 RepID=UPI00117BA8D3|nr:DUF1684 domain-containing protein [Fulvivirga sp. M361]TRX52356.1 DUF1684 domain-containing protein [Fulvivirga sp. M361]